MARGFYGIISVLKKPKKKRPGVHSKCRHTNHKTGKYYNSKCKKYKGQGR